MEDFRFLSPVELLELLRKDQQNKGLPTSDYRLAKILGITQTSIIKIMKHNGSLSDENAIILADELILSRAYVVACMSRHRANNPELIEMWEEIAAQAFKNIAFVVLGFSLHYASFAWLSPFQ
jgi:hypothetical protein